MSAIVDFDLSFVGDDYIRAPLWIIGPRSYLSDRAIPLVDVIGVPARSYGGGFLKISGRQDPRSTKGYLRRRERAFFALTGSRPDKGVSDRYYVDLRMFGLGNWSHFINLALPVAVLIRDHFTTLQLSNPVFILDKDPFPAIIELLKYLGFDIHCTNRSVTAPLVQIDFSSSSDAGNIARVSLASISSDIDGLIEEVHVSVGGRIFLNRRPPNRVLKNNAEIREIILDAGFEELFMEDYSAAEQIALVMRASQIIAIHGASLAPLMFRTNANGPLQLIELAPPGHVVPYFRDMIANIPHTYRMVRGVPDPDMAAQAFVDVDTPSMNFTKRFSLSEFMLDPESLRFAFRSLDDVDFPNDTISRTT